MENKTNANYWTIDIVYMLKVLRHKAWMILLVGVLTAAAGFSIASFAITPTYSSEVLLYVNNASSSSSSGNPNFSISSSEITAAQSLVKTYAEILNNRTTLSKVIEQTGVSYTYEELSGMIKTAPANNTEIMKVTVTATDPYEAARIANGIAEVLPIRVAGIIDGATMEVVSSAVPVLQKVAPSITKFTVYGFVIGIALSIGVVFAFAVLDDTIHSEDYVIQNYECPILARIPDLVNSADKRYGYYYQTQKRPESKE